MINTATQVYCIIGDPVKHSFSPAIHNSAFQQCGINAVYTAFQVKDVENAVKGIRALGISGASVTIPHKVAVIPFLDEITQIASMIGSVNTIISQNGRLKGENTDALGFYRALSAKTEIKDKTIAVFGSGGSAKAVCFALFFYNEPRKVYIVARNKNNRDEIKQNLIHQFSENKTVKSSMIETCDPDRWVKIMGKADVIINTTPVGMDPVVDDSILNTGEIPESKVVMDLVYNPHQTLLLKLASEKNCTVVHGIDMLLYQGMEQFELWTGLKAPETVMMESLKSAIQGS